MDGKPKEGSSSSSRWWFKRRLYQQQPWSTKKKKSRVLSVGINRKWKKSSLKYFLVDGVSFRILYFLEGILLGAGLCFFFLCCGCHL
ncbi:uncharacterized protein M6B38_219430 [Iris pallida]|uniref:Uncharacterized protein n=1 Tax=Iris pallida TaxID=29817 RepID=A0AAX6DY32_IRIPA|nr:uncharacterized protein M6B38_219430 [Iris pallida]